MLLKLLTVKLSLKQLKIATRIRNSLVVQVSSVRSTTVSVQESKTLASPSSQPLLVVTFLRNSGQPLRKASSL
ncbi:Uncharacterised protein [Vibrio cholerae]|nr:Uncharacterised protein [Vibrio cholerae]